MADTPQQAENQPVFAIEKIYVKDLSLEIPNAPAIFWSATTPNRSANALRSKSDWR